MLGKVTQESLEDVGMDYGTKTMLAKIAEVEEEMKNTNDKRPGLSKANQILEEYSFNLEEHLGNMIARNAEVEAELEAILEEIARLERENLHCALSGPSTEVEGVEVGIRLKD